MRRAILLTILGLATFAPAGWATPVITPKLFGTPGDNGWYRSDVTLNWSVSDDGGHPIIATSGCDPATFTADTPPQGITVTCTATSRIDPATTVTRSRSVVVLIDRIAPTSVVAGADRQPDGAGMWFNHLLQATWRASDAGSGVASCTSMPYAGPDGTNITLTGTCRDRAGNVGPAVPFTFSFDATPPVVSKVTASIGTKTARLSWEVAGAATVSLIRASASAPTRQRLVYTGAGSSFLDHRLTSGRHYTYFLRATDVAGNVASGSVNVTPGAASKERLLAPRANAKLRKPPLLRWRKVKNARYYNVQVFRHGRKILSAWPSKPHYQLHRTWRYHGRRHRLVDGTYRWYLWAGYGKRSARHYGRLLGQRSFIVR
jgi:hypothetical protein